MGKKLIKVSALLEALLALAAYFSIRYAFKNNPSLFSRLQDTDSLSVLLRLTIYIIPGILLLGSLYAVTFKTRSVLIKMGFIELLTALVSILFSYIFKQGMNFVLVSIVVSVFYIFSAFKIKE